MKKEVDNAPEVFPVELVAVKLIDPSPANKRTTFDEVKLKELGDSIAEQGLLQAVTLRKSPLKKGRYELVCGERRWRAVSLKGWAHVPAVVRELSDRDAHGITASENLQREDLTPIEESESIRVMQNDGYANEEIADKLGKPISWVARRSRIAELSKKWLDAISDPKHPLSKWTATHLELISRYDHEGQDELFKESYGQQYNADTALLTVKELEAELNRNLLSLSAAPWKVSDEILHPSAGACSNCQKRTSCSPSLFEPIEDTGKVANGDRCIDRDCWGKKLMAFHMAEIKKAAEKNAGMIIIDKSCNGAPATLPDGHPWKKSIAENYKYKRAKKSDPDAVPAYIIDGPGAGKVEYRKLEDWYKDSGKKKQVSADGSVAPKSIEEKQEGLQKRRVIRFVNKLILILSGKDPDSTDTKNSSESNDPVDMRRAIASKLSHIEVHALVAAFGASTSSEDGLYEGEDAYSHRSEWSIFKNVVQMNGSDAATAAVRGAFDRMCDALKQLTYSAAPNIEFPDSVCAALRLDREAIWKKVLEEIPEPKAWVKAQTAEPEKPLTKKKKAKGKISTLADVVDTDEDDCQ
jgi:ParB/RepB/Spo0J family partition protein